MDKKLSPEYSVAKQSLEQAVKDRDPAVLRAGLTHQVIEIRLAAVDGLVQLGDRESVPSLIAALRDNQAVRIGGSETQILQSRLSSAIVQALGKLTGLDFAQEMKAVPADIDKVIVRAEAWWKSVRR